ncbi:Proteasome subunit beta type-2 [Thelohanellus kitauei]|uniref:Proteasome subunit beta n=1 Tax=Thelohanellus kitauei TaxID=669202 RepID=A0A0C2NA60_THEKT|nr:Proteasome subunit beta type-2 [Thelohanellus kitauei]
MEFVLGLKCNDFVLLACDKKKCRGIMCQKDDVDKMYKVGSNQLLAIVGQNSDDVQFAEFIQRNMAYLAFSNGFEPSTSAIANFSRQTLANSIRSQGIYQANMFIGGWDEGKGTSLYFLDYLGSLISVPFGCHGYGSYFALSILDRFYNPNLEISEAVKLLWMIVRDIEKRFIVNLPKFLVRIVDKNGITVIEEELTLR